MPYIWSPEAERALLLAAIQEADLKPSKTVWANVATALGGGLTAGAVRYTNPSTPSLPNTLMLTFISQKFAKIKVAANNNGSLAPTTPAKKPTTSKSNGSGTGGRKRKKTKTEEYMNGTEVKAESGGESKVKSENGEETSESDETPTKRVKTEGQEGAKVSNGAKGGIDTTNGADGTEDGTDGADGINGSNGSDGTNGANGVGEDEA